MLVVAKRNIILPSVDGKQAFPLHKGNFTDVPEWAVNTPYFAALKRDGKVSVPENHSDKALREAESEPVRRRGKRE